MTRLHLMADGALAAAELIALLFAPPAMAAEPARVDAVAAVERNMALHRVSTTVGVRLLGSLADVRVAQRLRNDGPTAADLGPRLPAIDESVDALRVVRGDHAVELLHGGECGDSLGTAHARLSDDEAVADALQLAPGQAAVVETISSTPLIRAATGYRVALPFAIEADEPRAIVVDQGDIQFLLVLPHRRARAATLVIRSVSGEAEAFQLDGVDPRFAILIPLEGRTRLDDIAGGAVEFELLDRGSTYWSTLAAERIDARDAAQARLTE